MPDEPRERIEKENREVFAGFRRWRRRGVAARAEPSLEVSQTSNALSVWLIRSRAERGSRPDMQWRHREAIRTEVGIWLANPSRDAIRRALNDPEVGHSFVVRWFDSDASRNCCTKSPIPMAQSAM